MRAINPGAPTPRDSPQSGVVPIQYLALRIKEASENPDKASIQLVDALQAVTVSSLEFDHSIKLLMFLTQYCSKIGSPPAILELVLQRWCADDNDVDNVIGDLASMISVSSEVLTYVCQTLSLTSTLFGVLETVIENRKGSNIGFGITANRLITAFGTLPGASPDDPSELDDATEPEVPGGGGTWENLLQVTIRTGKPKNGDTYQYITEKLGQMSQPAPRPKWVNVITGETLQLLKTTPRGHRPPSEMVDRVVQRIESQIAATQRLPEPHEPFGAQRLSGVSEGETLDSEEPSNLTQMIEMYVSTSIPEELKLLDDYSNGHEEDHVEENPNNDSDVIGRPERLWGPVNAMLGRGCSVNDGPCRMLSCLCRDLDQECDEDLQPVHINDPDVWFTGSCDSCRRRIINLSYALRFPVTNGGWVGCFCSWACLMKDPPRPIFTAEATAIARVRAVIDEFGIFDRASVDPSG